MRTQQELKIEREVKINPIDYYDQRKDLANLNLIQNIIFTIQGSIDKY